MTDHPKEPCEKCPYKVDSDIGLWAKEHYESVLKNDHQFGNLFLCHKDKVNRVKLCAGWLLDQKNRGIPNLHLRMACFSDPSVLKAFDNVSDGGHEMYDSAREMAEFNIEHGVYSDDEG